jgi:hypothetical protein
VVTTRTTRANEEDAMTVHHRSRSPIVCAALAATIASFLSAHPTPAVGETMSRVRSSDRSIVDLIEQATKHSPTLTRLVATVEASNGIVYVEPGVCPQGLPACLNLWMLTSGSTRYMRIVLDRRRLDSDLTLMGAVGHELQHAIEVLSDRSVTDSDKMFFFYRRYAPTRRDRFETQAAIKAGDAVEHELRNWRAARP